MTVSSGQGGGARERLLARLLDTFPDDLPAPEMSLREVATRAETSHALLRYHFGSLTGVLVAMLTAQRRRDNEALVENGRCASFDDLVMEIWRSYMRPEQLSRARGFFHVAGLAAYDAGAFPEFTESLDDLTRLLASLAEREGDDTAQALRVATVVVAAIRGLLLQQVLTPALVSEDTVNLVLAMRTVGSTPTRKS